MLAVSTGMTTLVQNTDYEGTVYDKIYMDYYVVASLNQIVTSTSDTELRITGIKAMPSSAYVIATNPGTSLVVDSNSLANGEVTVNVTRNGESCELADLAKDDIVALRYDIKYSLANFGIAFNKIDIIATTDTVTGKYSSYDTDTDEYIIGGVRYKAAKTQSLTLGSTYTFRLDPFGRLFDAEEEATSINYAIVERYVDMSLDSNLAFDSDYDFIDVVTLTGEAKRLFIDTSASESVRTAMNYAGITASKRTVAANVPIESRIIEYKIKTATGRLNAVVLSTNIDAFTVATYNPTTNRLSKPLDDKAVVLDATSFDINTPTSDSFVLSSLSNLSEDVDYNGVLVHKNNDNEWCYVIITAAPVYYTGKSDFAVVAARASWANSAIVDDEEVYQITVMQNGDNEATRLNVSMDAEIFVDGISYSYNVYCASYLREGTVFYYKTDTYGLVDRIDVILQGGYNYDTIKALVTEEYDSDNDGVDDVSANISTFVKLPASTEIRANTWFVDVDEKDNTAADERVQLFIAPVMTAGTNNISFGAMKTDANGLYVDTNADFGFSLADDANVYDYDLGEAGTGANAFRGGAFIGFDVADAASTGEAYMVDVAGEMNFYGLVQFAFVMAVDGEITNALVINA